MTHTQSSYPYIPQKDDLVLVGYPKSGNNMLLFRLVRLLYGERMDWVNKSERVQIVGGAPTVNDVTPRLLWTHEASQPGFPKVIYIVRDPRDIVLSYHHHNSKYFGPSGWSLPFSTFFDDLVNGLVWPGRWECHVEAWLGHKANNPDAVLVVRYEDLIADAVASTRKLAAFLNCGAGEQDIEDAVEWSTFSNMRRLEDAQSAVIDAAIKGSKPQERLHFVRNGRTRAWEDALSVTQRERAEEVWGNTMRRLGYT